MGLRKTEATGLVGWVDQRLSIMDAWNNHLAQYWAPKNFNVWYFFGLSFLYLQCSLTIAYAAPFSIAFKAKSSPLNVGPLRAKNT